jgi:hypothetical protein
MYSLTKQRLGWYVALLALVVTSNYLLYHFDHGIALSQGAVLGTLFDFILVIPLLTYFFILRNRYSLKYIILVALAGYGAAHLIVPNGLLASYSFVKYILFAGEGALILLELYIMFKVLTKARGLLRTFRSLSLENPSFSYVLEKTLSSHFKESRMLHVFCTDITMIYYALFAWKKKPVQSHQTFSYHQKSSFVALYIMLIHALVLESVGFHFFLHSWNPIVAFVVVFLNLYTLLFLLAEIQAVRLNPIIIGENKLFLQIGLTKRLIVECKDIKSVSYDHEDFEENQTDILDGVLADFIKEKPSIEIEFYEPQIVKLLYGFEKQVTKVHLRPDDSNQFYNLLQSKISK